MNWSSDNAFRAVSLASGLAFIVYALVSGPDLAGIRNHFAEGNICVCSFFPVRCAAAAPAKYIQLKNDAKKLQTS